MNEQIVTAVGVPEKVDITNDILCRPKKRCDFYFERKCLLT